MSSETGDQLRRARQSKGLTMADAEKATRIKARYLEALEAGRWNDLPGPVQARGFMKNYAALLGLDGDALAAAGAREAQASPPDIQPQISPAPPGRPPPQAIQPPESPVFAQPAPPPAPAEQFATPAWLSVDMIAGGVAMALFVVVALLAARTYVVPLVSRLSAPSPEPTGLAATRPQAAITPTRAAVATPTAVFPVNPNGGIQIGLAALEHAWVRVTTDGMTAFEGLFTPGQSMTWDAREQLIVETGNGAAFNFAVNGKSMGPLGARHKITIRAWSPRSEVVAPSTPTAAPPTDTPEPAPTLVPTLTP